MQIKVSLTVLLALSAFCAVADTEYPIPGNIQKANRAKIEAVANGAYWKGSSVASCAVEPMSGIRRIPDLFPTDGDFKNPIRIIAAQGEYEPASFMLFAFEDMTNVEIKVTDLVSKDGSKIAASEIDLTVVKIWYQMGTAWYGFHADHLRRIATPELMLHDENLIRVDHQSKENYLRCDYKSGVTEYRWISFLGAAGDHRWFASILNEWIHDAKTIQPVSLQKNAFKQFFATIHVPVNTKEGIYKGGIAISAGGKTLSSVPLSVRVLPFELPLPATRRDLDREFYSSAFIRGLNLANARNLAENLVAHNMLNPLFPRIDTERGAKDAFGTAIATGLGTNRLFASLPGADLRTSYPLKETDAQYNEYKALEIRMSNTLDRLERTMGKNAQAFAYGIDEARPESLRAERATWQMTQRLGGKVMTTTHFHPYLLFNLDFALTPCMPNPMRKKNADLLHDTDPNALIGWYADPHSGPESPHFARVGYGWSTWQNNYDMFCQYILFRDDWTEFFIPKEANLRGLMLCYPQDNDVIDTLAWEGVREAVDDIKYATQLRLLSREASKSKNMDTVYAGRAAVAWLMQTDLEAAGPEYVRMEIIRRIMDLRERLGK